MQQVWNKYEILRTELNNEKATFVSHWKDLGDHIEPRRPRFYTTDVNKGDRRNQKIFDSTASQASDILSSGMMTGVTSPARPWFELGVPDPALSENESVKFWLSDVTKRMRDVFRRSNLYEILPTTYSDLGTFGTAAILVEEDAQDVMHFRSLPIGSYAIATDDRGRVNVFFREFRMTVRQIVSRFGQVDGNEIDWSRISTQVRSDYEAGHLQKWVDVCHCIKPNDEYNPRRLESKFKRFISVYYERGTETEGPQRFLRESGYDLFPVLVPRWQVTGEDYYGTKCPGMVALGDIKQLQTGEKRSLQAIDKSVNPPMKGPTSLMNQKHSILPGDMTFYDVQAGGTVFEPAHQVTLRLDFLEQKQEQVRDRIKRAFYADLFLMLANSDRRQITAREIEERHEEKLLALGPVLERLNRDLLDPLIDLAFHYMMLHDEGLPEDQRMIPPPPEELQGRDLKVDYISIMHQAQKLVALSGVERFAAFVGSLGNVRPDAWDKVNVDQLVDVYGDLTSVPPGIVISDEDAMAAREQRASMEQAIMQNQMLAQGAQTAKNLSQANLEGRNALTQVLGDLSGQAA